MPWLDILIIYFKLFILISVIFFLQELNSVLLYIEVWIGQDHFCGVTQCVLFFHSIHCQHHNWFYLYAILDCKHHERRNMAFLFFSVLPLAPRMGLVAIKYTRAELSRVFEASFNWIPESTHLDSVLLVIFLRLQMFH